MIRITITVDDAVALRKESVDRNDKSKRLKTEKRKVALRKESVDRNGML